MRGRNFNICSKSLHEPRWERERVHCGQNKTVNFIIIAMSWTFQKKTKFDIPLFSPRSIKCTNSKWHRLKSLRRVSHKIPNKKPQHASTSLAITTEWAFSKGLPLSYTDGCSLSENNWQNIVVSFTLFLMHEKTHNSCCAHVCEWWIV